METPRWNGFGVLYALIIGSAVVLLVLSIPFASYAAYFTHLSDQYSTGTRISHFPVYLALLEVDIPITPYFGVVFLALVAIYALCLVVAALQGGGLVRALVNSAHEGAASMLKNPLSATTMLLGTTLLLTVFIEAFQTSVGVQTGGLSGDSFLLLMDLTLSPLIEEIGFRLVLIGVPIAVLLLVTRADLRKVLKSMWRPSAAWEDGPAIPTEQVTTSRSTFRNVTYFLIASSSILFGLAHYLSGAGWDIGKVSEAAFDGAVIAYLYVRYGLHAGIIFHWAVDFAVNGYAFYGQGVYGIDWTSNSVFSLIPQYDVLVVVGIPGLVFFGNLILKRVIRPKPEATGDDSSRQVYPDTTSREVQGNLSDKP